MYQLKYKIWIDKDGKVFGKGPLELLNGVKESGSLADAARRMDMSYNKAFTLIKNIEEKLGFKLITSKSGGSKGGGSELTEEAEKLIAVYQNFYEECERNLKDIFEKHFKNFNLQ
ncbi:MAG: winged helix-turn-helix domain-containing protein [Caulobacteraceae bacterium]